jgi:hypothetical protein
MFLLLWHIEPLLDKNFETNETVAVVIQQRGKYASTSIELLLEMVFSARFVQSSYKEHNWVVSVT